MAQDSTRKVGSSSLADAASPAPAGNQAPAVGKRTLVDQAGGGGGGVPLPAALRTKMEHSFGADFSAVRIHESSRPREMGALAYAQGTDIYVQPGLYQPGSPKSDELIGHELAHVVQQASGRVAATTQAKGMAVNADDGLEREADEAGARAARGEAAGGAHAAPAIAAASHGPVQRKLSTTDGAQVDIQTPADVQALFQRQNVHFYFKYVHALEMIDDLTKAGLAVPAMTEAAAVQWIMNELRNYEATADEHSELPPGAQEHIQRKLVEICELARTRHTHGAQPLGMTKQNERFTDDTTQWYDTVVSNGLCGGWSKLHRENPKWIEQLWQAVESWTPTEGLSTEAECRQLEDHLRSALNSPTARDPMADVTKILRDAYRHMDKLEPDAKYGAVPQAVDIGEAQEQKPGKLAAVGGKQTIEVTSGKAGSAIVAALQKSVRGPGDYVAHVETPKHHMSVRMRAIKSGIAEWGVLESEIQGVASTKDVAEIREVLEHGVFLDKSDKSAQEIDIRVFRTS